MPSPRYGDGCRRHQSGCCLVTPRSIRCSRCGGSGCLVSRGVGGKRSAGYVPCRPPVPVRGGSRTAIRARGRYFRNAIWSGGTAGRSSGNARSGPGARSAVRAGQAGAAETAVWPVAEGEVPGAGDGPRSTPSRCAPNAGSRSLRREPSAMLLPRSMVGQPPTSARWRSAGMRPGRPRGAGAVRRRAAAYRDRTGAQAVGNRPGGSEWREARQGETSDAVVICPPVGSCPSASPPAPSPTESHVRRGRSGREQARPAIRQVPGDRRAPRSWPAAA